jgi:hypothetical protein
MVKPTDVTRTTDDVIDRFNRAFRERDATLLADIIAPDCVTESVQPALDDSVGGVNVMRIVDGKIVDAAGYSKTAPVVASLEG